MTYHVQFPGLGLALTVNRVAVSIGGFNIYWYGVIIAAGMMLALLYAFRNAVDFGIDSDRLVDVVAIGAVMAIVCARIYYVAMAPFKYNSIWEMIDIRLGGIAIYGAVIGAFVFGGLAAKWRKIPLLPLFDLVSLGFLIGQGIGRWGNFVNQEAFGTNTTLPWGMYSEGTEAYLKSVQVTLPAGMAVDPTAPVHPTFLYESIWCLAGFVILASLVKRRKFNGQIFLSYIIWYGLGRSWIEGLRTDSLLVGNTGLRASQLVAIGSVIAAAMLLIIGLRNAKGKQLQVTLAVSDIKKQAEAGNRFTPDTLPANAPHADFVKATDEMNRRLKDLDLDAPEIEELEDPAPKTTEAPKPTENAAVEAEAPAEPEEQQEPNRPKSPGSRTRHRGPGRRNCPGRKVTPPPRSMAIDTAWCKTRHRFARKDKKIHSKEGTIMGASIIDGKALAAATKAEAAEKVTALKAQGVNPCLAVILVGENPASQVYVRGKINDCAQCGIESRSINLPADTTQETLLAEVKKLADDPAVHGILVQLPLPEQIDEKAVIDAIPPEKDVDGFSPINVGRMQIGEPCYLPCTPAGCIRMIESTGTEIAGKNAVVIGRSNIVGKPAALLLLAKNATVTICHSKTKNLKEVCAAADILVAAVGREGFVTGDMVKPGAVVIDVGINRGADGKLHGDVNFAEAGEKAGYITPVPGGVGPMTRAMLMLNTVEAAARQSGKTL